MRNKFFVILLFLPGLSFGQFLANPGADVESRLPVSPAAASLGKFYDVPVYNYTGIPSTTIPIMEVKHGAIQLPISLNYQGGGIKVDEMASQAGLGWSINAGGIITRVVRGLADDEGFDRTLLNKYIDNQMMQAEKINYVNSVARNQIDAQPDLYYLNLPGMSFKFFQDRNGTWVQAPKNSKIKIQPDGFNWIITSAEGIKYKFRDQEVTSSVTTSESSSGSSDYGSNVGTTSWCLSEIEDTNGNKVFFYYDDVSISLTNVSNESVQVPDPQHAGPCVLTTSKTITTSSIGGKFISRIEFNNNKIAFIKQTGTRLDSPGDAVLSAIEIWSGGSLYKKFRLFHSYFSNNSDGIPVDRASKDLYRLKLDSLREESGNMINPAYVFNYHRTVGLPYRNSYSQDHWGYYNGAGNTSAVTYIEGGLEKGANKKPNFQYALEGTLTKIKFPTGGYVQLEYEGNRYFSNRAGDNRKDTSFAHLAGNNNDSAVDFYFSLPFTIKETVEDADGGGSNMKIVPRITFSGVEENCSCWVNLNVRGADGKNYELINDRAIYLPKGMNYTIEGSITTEFAGRPYVYFSVSLMAKIKTSSDNLTEVDGPGIRIGKIIKDFGDGNREYKSFEYTDPSTGKTSGEIGSLPEYHNRYSISYGAGGTVPSCIYDVYSSTSHYPLSSTFSSFVGYGYVTEYTDVNKTGSIGKTLYRYTNYRQFGDAVSSMSYPYPPSFPVDWKRGLILAEEVFRKNGTLYEPVMKKTYSYIQPAGSETSYQGLKVGTAVSYSGAVESVVYGGRVHVLYPMVSDAFLLGADTSFYYDGGTVSKIKNYKYSSIYLLNGEETIKSDGSKEVTLTTYPDDYAAGTAFVDNMKSAGGHLVAYPIEQVRYKEVGTARTILSGRITKYVAGGKGLVDQVLELETAAPMALSAFKFSNRAAGQLPVGGTPTTFAPHSTYATRLTYSSYDAFGNPQQVTPALGTPTTYIWSYGGQYLVAEIKNASFATVQTAIGGAAALTTLTAGSPAEADLRSKFNGIRVSLPNSSLTYYTYKPLIGVTSSTDPSGRITYYSYDGFGRLQTVKDTQQKTKETLNYHYRNQ